MIKFPALINDYAYSETAKDFGIDPGEIEAKDIQDRIPFDRYMTEYIYACGHGNGLRFMGHVEAGPIVRIESIIPCKLKYYAHSDERMYYRFFSGQCPDCGRVYLFYAGRA